MQPGEPPTRQAYEPPSGEARGIDPRRFVRLGALFYGSLFLLAVIWRVGLYGENLFYAPGGEARGSSLLGGLAAGLAAGLGVVALSYGLTVGTAMGRRLAESLARLLGNLSARQCVLLALLSGIGEEAFFRGALQPRVGLVLASLIFGLAHFVPRRDLAPWSGFSLAAGFLLGALFEWTGNLLAPIAAHVVVNAVNLQLLTRRRFPPPR